MRRVELSALPLNAEALGKVEADRNIAGVLVWPDDGRDRLMAFGPGCHVKSERQALGAHPGATMIWTRPSGRTQHALKLLQDFPGLTPYAAAKEAGVNVSAVYRAKARTNRPACACCGQRLPA